jgi:CDP-diacylglycerol pyrophosphatase
MIRYTSTIDEPVRSAALHYRVKFADCSAAAGQCTPLVAVKPQQVLSATAIGQVRRDVLLQVVRICVANYAVTGFAFPCLEVNTTEGEDRGYVVLRRPGLRDIVLAPTRPVVGLEDPWLRTAAAPNYLEDAWNARHFLKELRQRQLAHDDVALAVNSGLSRAEDQLHIHIGCLAPRAREAIRSIAPELSENGLVFIERGLYGIDVWARQIGQNSLDTVNPLRLAAEGIPDALGNLASMGLVVAASSLGDGRNGFVALAWFDDVAIPKHAFAAEGLLDPRCSR